MAKITKPDISIQWAQAGSISVPSDVKKQTGWTVEKPASEYMNWLQNRQDNGIAYSYQMGISEWDGTTEYQYASGYASYVQYNGVVYKAIQTGTNKIPSTETGYWTRAFDDYGAASTVNTALTNHITNYGTLASLSNTTTARSNLSVYSIAQCDAAFAPVAGNSAQTFLVGAASSANHAVRKSQFDAKTGQADETTAGIAEVATNTEALAGLSDAAIVTPLKLQYVIDNKSATTSTKGTVELATDAETISGTDTNRALTASNITGLFTGTNRKGNSANGYQVLPGGLILQWGKVSLGLADTSTSVTFPKAFSTSVFTAVATGIYSGGADMHNSIFVHSVTTATMSVRNEAVSVSYVNNPEAYWFAIGY
jgi:hypothetical protein